MSLFVVHREEYCLLGIWRMNESMYDLCLLLNNSALCQEAMTRFSSLQRRREWLSVRLLLWNLLHENKEIAYTESGKPYLKDGSFHISISHTKEYVSVILSDYPVGIDVEQYGLRVKKIASRFLRADEQICPYLGDDTWSFLLHWCAKEVLFKCMDTIEVDFIRHLRIYPFVPQRSGVFKACEYKTTNSCQYEIYYHLYDDLVLTYTILFPQAD